MRSKSAWTTIRCGVRSAWSPARRTLSSSATRTTRATRPSSRATSTAIACARVNQAGGAGDWSPPSAAAAVGLAGRDRQQGHELSEPGRHAPGTDEHRLRAERRRDREDPALRPVWDTRSANGTSPPARTGRPARPERVPVGRPRHGRHAGCRGRLHHADQVTGSKGSTTVIRQDRRHQLGEKRAVKSVRFPSVFRRQTRFPVL